jgi:hypothetical protein
VKKGRIWLSIIPLLAATPIQAWDGYDHEKGSYVEIEKGNLVRRGQDIEIFDHNDGSYHDATVESIRRSGSSVEVEILDHETGETRTLEMDDH